MAGGRGVCLAGVRGGVSFVARVFDATFAVGAELPLAGVPSRAQVSPDGSLAATTVFVSGHSYADTNLSTRTSIIDLAAGRWLVEDLETFAVYRDGRRIDSPDFNFWGVTFLQDSRTFYATLATKGRTYLVKGSVDRKAVDVVAPDIECPSISPDNQAIAYKQRVAGAGPAVQWEVWLYDLTTRQRRALGERQPIDDQVQWLDDSRVMYARPTDGDPASTELWFVNRTAGRASGVVPRPGGLSSCRQADGNLSRRQKSADGTSSRSAIARVSNKSPTLTAQPLDLELLSRLACALVTPAPVCASGCFAGRPSLSFRRSPRSCGRPPRFEPRDRTHAPVATPSGAKICCRARRRPCGTSRAPAT